MMNVDKVAWYFEKRGSKENRIIKHKIESLRSNGTVLDSLPLYNKEKIKLMDIRIEFLSKIDLCSGIEIADLCGYSIGRTVRDFINKDKENTWKYSFQIFKTLYFERRIKFFNDRFSGIFEEDLFPKEIIESFEKKRALRPATGNSQSEIKYK